MARWCWCHIDAYDDVPLTAVTAQAAKWCHGNLDDPRSAVPRGRGPAQREKGTQALATAAAARARAADGRADAVCFDADQEFGEARAADLLDIAARRTGEAIRRVRSDALGTGPTAGGPALGAQGHHAELGAWTPTRARPGMARRLPARAPDRVGRRRGDHPHRPALPLRARQQRDHARPRHLRARAAPRRLRAQRGARGPRRRPASGRH